MARNSTYARVFYSPKLDEIFILFNLDNWEAARFFQWIDLGPL